MINTTLNIIPLKDITPTTDQSAFQTVIPPIERVKLFSDDAFEDFIAEWAVSCARTRYKDVYRIGGAHDKGRDVIAEYASGEFDYYQCKKYASSLQPSEYWIEFGKLCFFTFNGDIPAPKKYYIIASNGLSQKMRTLLNDKGLIRTGLIENWNKHCRKKIIKNKEIVLSGNLLKFIQNFDFTIIDTYSITTIIEEHRHTNYFYFRFGGNIKPQRPINIEPPLATNASENKYVAKIFTAYSENKQEPIDTDNLKKHKDLLKDFNYRRCEYYSAESLRRCIRDIFSTENEFEFLKKEMHSGIRDFANRSFTDGLDKLQKTLHESTHVSLSASILDNNLHFICNDDRKGICHHLANDDLLDWSTES